ncbi:hypothetical protein [Cellulomonas sp. NPDC089187]|uniref:hypothetical protein n=1 Tax=Cellulomonas sp. NPDC089187 TaxID=3154970 RepID=UPI003422169A
MGLTRARRRAGVTLALLGGAGLAVSAARAMSWEQLGPVSTGACVVDAISIGYEVDYDPALGGYAVTTAQLSGVPTGCAGRELALTLRDGADRALVESRTAVTAPMTAVVLTPGVAAEVVAGASVAVVAD